MPIETSVILPKIRQSQLERVLETEWGIQGTLARLPGERDLNFCVRMPGSREEPVGVLKVCNAAEEVSLLECQEKAFSRVAGIRHLQFPGLIPTREGLTWISLRADDGTAHLCRLTRWVVGKRLAELPSRESNLYHSLGQCMALVDRALHGLDDEVLQRPFPWDLCRALEVLNAYRLPESMTASTRVGWIDHFSVLYRERVLSVQDQLRQGAIHNDANDHNVLIRAQPDGGATVCGLIDFGDLLHGWLVSDLAIACAYAILDQDHPLDVAADIVAGYHEQVPLCPEEIGAIFSLIGMRLCLSVCIAAGQQAIVPENDYLSISTGPAWRMLEILYSIPPDYAEYLFRVRCGLDAVPISATVQAWLSDQESFFPIVDPDPATDRIWVMDLSIHSTDFSSGLRPYDVQALTREIFQRMEENGSRVGIGRYAESRRLYDSDDFVDFSGHRRTLHLGQDLFQPVESPVFAPLIGSVYAISDHPEPFDYGGTVILSHQAENGVRFYTLYGHLNPSSLSHLERGQPVMPGQFLGKMGDHTCNGGWPPHVHFEIITDLLGFEDTFMGVGSDAHRDVWLSLCPDPNLILRLEPEPSMLPLVPS